MRSTTVPGSDSVYSIDPNDLVIFINDFGHQTTYKVEAVLMGGTGETSVVELVAIDRTCHCEIKMPIELLNAAISTEQVSIYKG